jgi:hypothetical protein
LVLPLVFVLLLVFDERLRLAGDEREKRLRRRRRRPPREFDMSMSPLD